MPLRPPPYSWVLPHFDPPGVTAAARASCDELGLEVKSVEVDDGTVEVCIMAGRDAIDAAAIQLDSDRDEIEPPGDGSLYRMVLLLSPPTDDDPRPRMEVMPYDDNWAAWAVVGPLAERVAGEVGGTEITGDPAFWTAQELAREEPPAPAQLPFLALRSPALFPGLVSATTFGRVTSIASIEHMLANGRDRIALVLQRDPAREEPPAALDDVLPIAIDARILKALHGSSEFILVLKGIARLHVSTLDVTGALPSVTVHPVSTPPQSEGGFSALRAFAATDRFVCDAAGASLLARVDELDPGFLADLVAKAHGDAALALRALLEVDPIRRARLVEEAVRSHLG